ncbi:hypothetical protein BL254_22930 [Protofrankia sp. BMG5.30]|uniref:ANTAR domain-containing protein n=1 Tax=Protofrankia coriariae TaxID=1562887 RepID=A0ABR5F1Y8_9ACTN|nr:hypothetical protein FrCorBMG51_15715 [Protofrankia coriariae]ONH31567.1 hypothetical protein BL254_22930 [Protofrankia sp. BMG5.30]
MSPRSWHSGELAMALSASDMPTRGEATNEQGWGFVEQGAARLGVPEVRERDRAAAETRRRALRSRDEQTCRTLLSAASALYGGKRRERQSVDVASGLLLDRKTRGAR